MAVSYLSQPVQSSPYVAPLDLNLMAKVLSVKQGQFDANAQKVQSQVDTIASTDLMRGVDKDYVNSKLNTIVNNINGLGGVDLSNTNISNQISGYASSVYNDDKVISAISSTKRARALMSSYDKMKSDPKLMKYYSESNEYMDNKHLNEWMKDPNAGSSYSGPSTATRYTDYNADFQKMMKDVKAREGVDVVVDGFYISKTSHKTLTEAEIMSMARDSMTPAQRDQMQRDGVYLYEGKLGYGEKQLVSKAVESKVRDLEENTRMIDSLQHAAILERDPKRKTALNTALAQRQQYKTALEKEIPNASNVYSSIYKNNPNELMYKVYSDDYFKGLGSRYKIQQEDRNVTTNQPRLQAYLQDRQDVRQKNEINAAASLNSARMRNAREISEAQMANQKELKWMELLSEGKAEKDANGNYKLKNSATQAGGDLYALQPNKAPDLGDVENHYIPAAQNRISEIDNEISQRKETFLSDLLSQDVNAQTMLKDMSYDFNKDGKVTLADFEGNVKMQKEVTTKNENSVWDNLKNNVTRLGNGTPARDKISTTTTERYVQSKDGIPAYSLVKNPKAQKIIATALAAFDNLASGKPVAISKFPEGTAELVENIRMLSAEKDDLHGRINDFSLGQNNFDIPQFSDRVFPLDDKTQNSRDMGLAKSYLLNKGLITGDPSKVDVLGIGRKADGSGYTLKIQQTKGSGNKQTSEVNTFDVDNTVAKMFDIEDGPYSVLNRVVTGIGKDYIAPVQNQFDDQFVANIRTFKNGSTNSFSVQYGQFNPATNSIEYKNLPPAVLGSRTNRFGSAAQAYSFGKDLISNFGKTLTKEQQKNLKEVFESKLNEY